MKILFDTDPGIDDAMALLMLARDRRAELVGITTVFGNAPIALTTGNALALCERFGIDVPVVRGAEQPLVRPPGDSPLAIHGRDGMGEIGMAPACLKQVAPGSAAAFIADMARRHVGELTLVAVGPLTNLALALQHDPQLAANVARVVVMGGAFGTRGHCGNASPVAEANIWNDPHAAAQVFAAPWPLTVVGLDVTHEVLMSADYLDALGRDGGTEGAFIRDITRLYESFYRRRTGGGIYSHDASAVACALDPSPFTLRHGAVRVVTEGDEAGRTLQTEATRIGAETGMAADLDTDVDVHVHVDVEAHANADADADAEKAGASRTSVCIGVDAPRLLTEFRACFVR